MSTLYSDPAIQESIVPISVEQYRRMGDAGIIGEKTELIRGVILRKMNKSPLHTWTVTRLQELLQGCLPVGFELRKEEPITLRASEPEPDIAIVRSDSFDPRASHPSSAELVIEVAITTESVDRIKASIYAEANIPEYWLVLPERRMMERFRAPDKTAYQRRETIDFDSSVHLGPPWNCDICLGPF